MSSSYEYDPAAWSPIVAGLAAGAVGGIAGSLLALPLRSPDEVVANSLSIVIAALVIGLVSGMLWRRLRASATARRSFWMAIGLGFAAALTAIAVTDWFVFSNLIPYAAPVALVIFLSVGLLTPVFATVTVSPWIAAIPVVLALVAGVGLFGRGNVASGELGLEDLATTTTIATTSTTAGDGGTTSTTAVSGNLLVPDDLAAAYTATQGVATYTVPENLRGLDTQAVGRTEAVTGTVAPGGPFEFTVDLTTFESDSSRRDGRVREIFRADPLAVFAAPAFDLPAEVTVGEVIPLAITGDLTINGVTREVTWTVEAQVREDGIAVTGETDITLTEFGITPPSVGGSIVVEDAARLEVLFLAVPA